MIHYLTLGHLDADAVKDGRTVVREPLNMEVVMKLLNKFGEMDQKGNVKLGGCSVDVREGYVICPWLMPVTNHAVEVFARELHSETNCLMADVRNREIVSLAAFSDSNLSLCHTEVPKQRTTTQIGNTDDGQFRTLQKG